jgi:hypothetical protein
MSTDKKTSDSASQRWFIHIARTAATLAALVLAPTLSAASGDDTLQQKLEAVRNTCGSDFRELLKAAADREGIALNLEQLAVGSKFNFVFAGAPALGVELIDPLELRTGITQGMIYLDSPGTPAGAGFYVIRAVATEPVRLGRIAVRVERIRNGRVVAADRGIAHVWSLTVPPEGVGLPAQVGVGFDVLHGGVVVQSNCWSCPNGVTICVEKTCSNVDCLLPCPHPCIPLD